ncbi:hypothetical protein GCM10007053_24560 [Halioglobus pacificus]|uniref:Uncharacterized protein n=1 Tax=Parahalioglobus pacificus TaxID=930806 RepID=A0A918XKA4_9GAMM|nr:hypothetical protein GCM10007053_24560 [Halioglobus pacificus]
MTYNTPQSRHYACDCSDARIKTDHGQKKKKRHFADGAEPGLSEGNTEIHMLAAMVIHVHGPEKPYPV